MQQVIVRKQGRLQYSNWSSRVLTLDPVAGVLLLSKKGSPEKVDYHAMQPTHIEFWPHYDKKYVEEDFDSLPAKMTVRLAGCAYPATPLGNKKRPALVVNSAGTESAEAWVLRFTSLKTLREALVALEQLTRLRSSETSDNSFGDVGKTEPCPQLPVSAKELYCPIVRAWLLERRKKQRRRDSIQVL